MYEAKTWPQLKSFTFAPSNEMYYSQDDEWKTLVKHYSGNIFGRVFYLDVFFIDYGIAPMKFGGVWDAQIMQDNVLHISSTITQLVRQQVPSSAHLYKSNVHSLQIRLIPRNSKKTTIKNKSKSNAYILHFLLILSYLNKALNKALINWLIVIRFNTSNLLCPF